MADVHQNGMITTLHNLSKRCITDLEEELLSFQAMRPMSLVLLSLYFELSTPALAKIVAELALAPYLNEIVIGLDRASSEEYRHALQYFAELPQHHRVLGHDGHRLLAAEY